MLLLLPGHLRFLLDLPFALQNLRGAFARACTAGGRSVTSCASIDKRRRGSLQSDARARSENTPSVFVADLSDVRGRCVGEHVCVTCSPAPV